MHVQASIEGSSVVKERITASGPISFDPIIGRVVPLRLSAV
ncbi:hypothetical protein [Streptomyces broussonetiae]